MTGSFRRLLRNLRRADDADNLKLGDIIRTADPLRCDSLTNRAGDYLRMQLLTPASVAEARDLVRTGRWVIESEEPQQ